MARHFEFNMQTLKQISAVYVQFVTQCDCTMLMLKVPKD